MKKLIILSAATIMLASAVNAQSEALVKNEIKTAKTEKKEFKEEKKHERKELRKLEGKDVSYQAKEHFFHDFGNAPIITSERSLNFDEFIFTSDGRITRAYYDADANLVGTTQKRKFSELPEKAQQNISNMYKGYTPGDVLLFDDNEANETDMVLFGNQFDDVDSYFVELQKDNKKIVVQVRMNGEVSYFARMT